MHFNQQLTNSLIIGTQSSTRRKLFKDAGLIFQYRSPNINEEEILLGNKIVQSQQALRLAREKALHLSQINKNSVIVCFDTTVHINNMTIFKSNTKKECFNTLNLLNGKKHTLYTACVIIKNKRMLWSTVDKANITFKNNPKKKLKDYVNLHFNKIVKSVGCYNIESHGRQIIEKIDGSYYAILGVPLVPLYRALRSIK
jgi:septum formation protein